MDITPQAIHKAGLQLALDIIESGYSSSIARDLKTAIHEAEMHYLETVSCEMIENDLRKALIDNIATDSQDATVIDFIANTSLKGSTEFLHKVARYKLDSEDFVRFCELVSRGISVDRNITPTYTQMQEMKETHAQERKETQAHINELQEQIQRLNEQLLVKGDGVPF
jgi:uncharacterized protein (DUF1778 family)